MINVMFFYSLVFEIMIHECMCVCTFLKIFHFFCVFCFHKIIYSFILIGSVVITLMHICI